MKTKKKTAEYKLIHLFVFVKNDDDDAYSILKNTNTETFLITKIVILDYLLVV